jgi:2-polyprenyl-3-methyl-5-hydroxy-6-metoxy-1,4-benzoquinol methylase
MKQEVLDKLLNLNQQFYDTIAVSFAESRQSPMQGFFDMLTYLPQPKISLLDVGCGNGRYGHFMQEQGVLSGYAAVDFSSELLDKAREMVPDGAFYQRDMSQPGFLDGLGEYDVVACLAAMHHLPGRANRVHLLRELKGRVGENGRIFLATWQFTDSERQRRKIREWAEIGLSENDVEPGDFLLRWQRGQVALRYACMIDEAETVNLAAAAGLTIIAQFRNDGKEGNLSLYTILKS